MLRECGILIAREFTQVEARVLQAPKVNTALLLFALNVFERPLFHLRYFVDVCLIQSCNVQLNARDDRELYIHLMGGGTSIRT